MAGKTVSKEKPVIERVFELLRNEKQPRTFYELVDSVVNKNLKGNERDEHIARLYTNMNVDGRFLSIGDNFWGLKGWYPIEQREEDVAKKLAPKRKKKRKKTDEDDIDDDYDDEDYDEDLDDDDSLDDDDDDDEDEDDEEEEEKPKPKKKAKKKK